MKISFEILPAKTVNELPQLESIVSSLNTMNPSYFSIASGVSGAPPAMTVETTKFLSRKSHTHLVPHITCGDKTTSDVIQLLDDYLALGVQQVMVLRGNSVPSGEFEYASELVHFIREYTDQQLQLDVALDPYDLDYFQQKVVAGANSAITQFFYDLDVYARLLEHCQQHAVQIPIIPGILPITDAAKIFRLAKQCHVKLPKNMVQNLEKFAVDSQATLDYGVEMITELCLKLLKIGAPGLHFFTLNQVDPALRILHEIY